MRWRLGSGFAVIAVLCCDAAAVAAPPSRYSLADQCRTFQVGGGRVTRTTLGYGVGSAASERFYMKASGLGTYLLYGSDRKFVSAAPFGDGVIAASQPGPKTDWELRESAAGFTLTNLASGRSLAVGALGGLTQSSQGATFVPQTGQNCAAFPEIGLNATGEPWTGATPYDEVQGTIDGHNHVTAYEFLGGDAHCGEPWSRYGVTVALVDCPDHYPNGAGAVSRTPSTAIHYAPTTRSVGRPSRTGRRRPR